MRNLRPANRQPSLQYLTDFCRVNILTQNIQLSYYYSLSRDFFFTFLYNFYMFTSAEYVTTYNNIKISFLVYCYLALMCT